METASKIAQNLGITSSRLTTISNSLFGAAQSEFSEIEAEQIKGVVEVIRSSNERSVKKAVEIYQSGVAAANRIDPRKQQVTTNRSKPAVEGLGAALTNANETAKALAERQVTAILELTNAYVADWLVNGIPIDVISQQSLDRLEASNERVYAETLGKIDGVGNYLPALVQEFSPKMLSSAAID